MVQAKGHITHNPYFRLWSYHFVCLFCRVTGVINTTVVTDNSWSACFLLILLDFFDVLFLSAGVMLFQQVI